MSKNKKKRNKAYTGADAAIVRPVITRIEAVQRSKIGQFWFDKKKIIKPILTAAAVVAIVIILILQIISLANGG
jgi:hypothetical protein